MSLSAKQETWIQCTHCGKLFQTTQRVSIEKLYVAAYCPGCGEKHTCINCGDKLKEVDLYMDAFLDERYFMY